MRFVFVAVVCAFCPMTGYAQNVSVTHQYGHANSAFTSQGGRSFSMTNQIGANNTARQEQSGRMNISVINQFGTGHDEVTQQLGDFSVSSTTQVTSDVTGSVQISRSAGNGMVSATVDIEFD
ncbi:hypothetical protein AADZ90_019800 [Aestuariibius sp. 2305UL40-4]|uniref:hypothetical protein n=1 Tax=Aestuariibius violaceus TaxID=3234132 RepID=UPI00345E1EB9